MDNAGVYVTLPIEKKEIVMLEQTNLKRKLAKGNYQAMIPVLKTRLIALDTPLHAADLPVILIFEDWSATGRGQMIGQFIKNLDPRWFAVVNTQSPAESE